MEKKILLSLIFVFASFLITHAQIDLKRLRSNPDTVLTEVDDSVKVDLRPVEIPIPKLELSVDYWKHWTRFGINANQAYFSDNWKAGGVNSISVGVLTWHKSEYNKNNFNFTTEVDLKYGKIKNRDQLSKKNNDRIFWDNKLAYKISKSWSIYTSLTYESQFDIGLGYGRNDDGAEVITDTISSFMAPGYFTESLGLEYKPDNTFSLRFGTGTARQTLVLDNRVRVDKDGLRYGVPEGKKIKNDLAFQITANLDRDLSSNLNIKSRYNLFADYQDLGDPSHRLDLTLTAKVTRIVNVTLNGIMMYDSDVHPKAQFSESLALGLVFNFPR